MSDEIDIAQANELFNREQQIRAAVGKPSLPAVGQCYFCFECLPRGKRFCDYDCRDGWEEEQNAKARNGSQD